MSKTAAIPSSAGLRHPEIDWIKAVSILAVVLIHSLPSFLTPPFSAEDRWLQVMTRFAVPGFLFASGFLYAQVGNRNWLRTLGRRLRRLLIPYVCFSLLTYVYPMPRWGARTSTVDELFFGSALGPYWGSMVDALLFGSALGPYYYVFVIFWLTLATPLIALVPRVLFPVLVVVALAVQWGFESFQIGTSVWFWSFRDPLRWAAPFLLGWWISLHQLGIRSVMQRYPLAWMGLAASLWLAGAAYIAAALPGMASIVVAWLEIYASLALIFVVFVGRPRVPRFVLWLSEASYSIYLSHLFFISALFDLNLQVLKRVPGIFNPLRIGAAWAAGVFGGAGLTTLGRRVLGVRLAKMWLG